MTHSRWQNKYQNQDGPGTACEILLKNQHLLPASGQALDLACGLGGNALLLASKGLQCHAWDFSSAALKKLNRFAKTDQLDITTKEIDLETSAFPKTQFDVIVVSHYLHRSLCANICDALAPGGLLFYQTFCQQKAFEQGPKSAKFLLAENELLSLFTALKLVVYREERLIGNTSEGFRNQAMLIAQKPS
ncbi:MAG: class I SAM-dependent methyltransferase [Pseudomonadales bacterium]|nr:class I SAM-dependent methyltransferase [Pseudomonadales bacterium]